MLYQTTEEQKLRVCKIAAEMNNSNIPKNFITNVVELANQSQGMYELMEIWFTEIDQKDEALADMQDILDEEVEKSNNIIFKPIRLTDLAIEKNLEFKRKLLNEVNKQGGISDLSLYTGRPESSLNRFFNSAMTPRRIVLIQILNYLKEDKMRKLSEIEKAIIDYIIENINHDLTLREIEDSKIIGASPTDISAAFQHLVSLGHIKLDNRLKISLSI